MPIYVTILVLHPIGIDVIFVYILYHFFYYNINMFMTPLKFSQMIMSLLAVLTLLVAVIGVTSVVWMSHATDGAQYIQQISFSDESCFLCWR